jgi:hypothetical protein
VDGMKALGTVGMHVNLDWIMYFIIFVIIHMLRSYISEIRNFYLPCYTYCIIALCQFWNTWFN